MQWGIVLLLINLLHILHDIFGKVNGVDI